jgi:hypothetical protein
VRAQKSAHGLPRQRTPSTTAERGIGLAKPRNWIIDKKASRLSLPLTTGNDGSERIREESATYVARYRDGNGFVVGVSTKCRDKTAAQSVLADLERRAEKVRARILTSAEDRIADQTTKWARKARQADRTRRSPQMPNPQMPVGSGQWRLT